MSTAGNVVFLVCAALAVLGAVGTVVAKAPLRAAMALLLNILSLAGLYLTLHAELLAAVQLLVYAGAVVVLFVFVIMLIGPAAAEPPPAAGTRALYPRWLSVVLMGVLTAVMAIAAFKVTLRAVPAAIDACPPGVAECGQFGGAEAVGLELFSGAAVPFELVSVLLTVAIVGAIAIAKGRTAVTPGGE